MIKVSGESEFLFSMCSRRTAILPRGLFPESTTFPDTVAACDSSGLKNKRKANEKKDRALII
jgi:hypothetical protein